MTHGGECSRGSTVKNFEGGVYSRGENEISVRGGESWYSGGRKCQVGEDLMWEKVCTPKNATNDISIQEFHNINRHYM